MTNEDIIPIEIPTFPEFNIPILGDIDYSISIPPLFMGTPTWEKVWESMKLTPEEIEQQIENLQKIDIIPIELTHVTTNPRNCSL